MLKLLPANFVGLYAKIFQKTENVNMNLVFPLCRFIITVLVGSSLAFVCFAGAARNCERQRGHTYSFGVLDTLIACTYWLFAAVKIFDGEYPYTVKLTLSNVTTCVILSVNKMPANS